MRPWSKAVWLWRRKAGEQTQQSTRARGVLWPDAPLEQWDAVNARVSRMWGITFRPPPGSAAAVALEARRASLVRNATQEQLDACVALVTGEGLGCYERDEVEESGDDGRSDSPISERTRRDMKRHLRDEGHAVSPCSDEDASSQGEDSTFSSTDVDEEHEAQN